MAGTVPYTGVLINTPVPRGHPPEGAKALWASILWDNVSPATAVQISIPLHLVSTISQIVSVYVDNTQSFVPIIIQPIDTQQMTTIPAGCEGVYPVYTSATNINIFQVIPDQFSVSNIYFLNYYEVPWHQKGKTFVNGLFSQTGASSIQLIETVPNSNATLPGKAGHISAVSVIGDITVSAAGDGFLRIADIGMANSDMDLWIYRASFASGANNIQSFLTGLDFNFGWLPAVGGPGLNMYWDIPNLTQFNLAVVLYQ